MDFGRRARYAVLQSAFIMKPCPSCRYELPEISRFCTQCGRPVHDVTAGQVSKPPHAVKREALNLTVLYGMVATLLAALLFPPWETPASQSPEFLGMHFLFAPPTDEAVVSRLLLTIELTTIAIAGLYLSFLLRHKH